jgi:hypothetical protein
MEILTTLVDTVFTVLFHPFTFLLYGLITHFGRKILAAKTHDTDNLPSLTDYWKKNRLNSLLTLIGAMVGYGLMAHFPDFDQMGQEIQNVVRGTAFGIGYMADSMADAVGQKALRKVQGEGT